MIHQVSYIPTCNNSRFDLLIKILSEQGWVDNCAGRRFSHGICRSDVGLYEYNDAKQKRKPIGVRERSICCASNSGSCASAQYESGNHGITMEPREHAEDCVGRHQPKPDLFSIV